MNNWKLRENDTKKLTVKELIENTIKEEINKVTLSDDVLRPTAWNNTIRERAKHEEEGYYRALYLLNQLL